MKALLYIPLCVIFFLDTSLVSSQNCIEYPIIDGTVCTACAPVGWDPVLGTEEIDNAALHVPDCIDSPPPSGGNVVGLNVHPGGEETVITGIQGLVPGSEYIFVMYWVPFSCQGAPCCPADLLVTLNGEQYVFSGGSDWQLAEICWLADDDQLILEISGISNGPSSYVFVDEAMCMDASIGCCSLVLSADDEEIVVCPDEPVQFDYLLDGISGSADFEWSSTPSDGIDYLDDPFAEFPTFTYTNASPNFAGAQYTFELFVEDDECDRVAEFEVNVLPHNAPLFPFDGNPICETDGELILPTTSLNNINGTWDITSILPDANVGQTINVFFTPDPGEVDCPITTEHFIEVSYELVPEFTFPMEFCNGSTASYAFPESSDNDVEGTWFPEEIIPSQYGEETIEIMFTPGDPFCIPEVILEIEILNAEPLNFDLPTELCTNETNFVFPLTSLEGIGGFWLQPNVNPSTTTGNVINTFIPDNSLGCYEEYQVEIPILTEVPVTFDIETTLCRLEGYYILSSHSIEGYPGQWNVPGFEPLEVLEDNITFEWIPTPGQSPCIEPQSLTINLIDPTTAAFSIPSILCTDDPTFTFPLVSDNGFVGTWTIEDVNPATSTTDLIVSSFIPEATYCIDPFTAIIQIEESGEAIFDLPTSICENDGPIVLSSNSMNGVAGSWTMDVINPMGMGGTTIQSVFIPNSNFACVESYDYSIEIQSAVAATFDLPDYLCWDDDILIFPTIADNNIEGSWDISEIDPSASGVEMIDVLFTPDDLACHLPFSKSIQIIRPFDLSILGVDPTSCEIDNGEITLSGNTTTLQMSLDAGANWQMIEDITGLGSGEYDIIIRDPLYPDCQLTLEASLQNPGAPSIDDVEVIQLSSCLENNGILHIDAAGINLEYSIDGGLTWFDNPVFTNLPAGTYAIIVRQKDMPDCRSQTNAEIEEFPLTEIIDIDANGPTDCNVDDGFIHIDATGLDLEYSIDGGISWSANPSFTNLPLGQYNILVQSMENADCFDEDLILFELANVPTILSVVNEPSSNCSPNSGSITIEASGSDLEYSIDGGITWSTSPFFTQLNEGTYDIVVVSTILSNCLVEEVTTIVELDELFPIPTYTTTSLVDCMVDDAFILFTVDPTYEFSIDGGANYQSSGLFDGLGAGAYEVLLRHVDYPDCNNVVNFEVESLDCPCADLTIEYEIRDIFCEDDQTGTIDIINILGVEQGVDQLMWSNGQFGENIDGLESGWHYLVINYDDDCVWYDSVFLMQYDPLTFGLTSYDSDCEDSNNGVIEVGPVQGGSGNYSYAINEGIFQDESNFYNLSAEDYLVTVLDENDCIKEEWIGINIENSLTVGLPEILTISSGDSLLLNPLINGATVDSFEWAPTNYMQDPSQLIAQVKPEEDITYELTLWFGECSETRSITILIDRQTDIFVPNIFQAEDAGLNDKFYIQGLDTESLEILGLSIYDRWGNQLFDKRLPTINNPDDGWDGRFNGQLVNPGVYVYFIEYINAGTDQHLVGTVTLLR